jgi:hypothetical protein
MFLLWTNKALVGKLSILSDSNLQQQQHRQDEGECNVEYGIGNYVENTEHIYGIYSIMHQLKKFNVTNNNPYNDNKNNKNNSKCPRITQFVMASQTMAPEHIHLLRTWLGHDNVHLRNRDYIIRRLNPNGGLWKPTFLKLFFWNMTQYDKIVTLDADILIRTSIRRWFDYPTPIAAQPKNALEINSGVMVITPNGTVFEDMMSQLPNLSNWDDVKKKRDVTPDSMTFPDDTGTGMYSDQSFIHAYYSKHADAEDRFKVMPIQAAALVSSLTDREWEYDLLHRRHNFETIHFTTVKPMRPNSKTNNVWACDFLYEYKDSIEGLEFYTDNTTYYKLGPHPDTYLTNCPARRFFPNGTRTIQFTTL